MSKKTDAGKKKPPLGNAGRKRVKPAEIVSAMSTVILIFLLSLTGYMAIVNMNGKVPSLFGYALVNITTSSMEPTIPTGSYILIKIADAADVKPDDIITYYSDDPAISGYANTHRVTEIITASGKIEFVTKGDYNAALDLYRAGGDKLIGIYVKNLPLLTGAVSALANKWIFVLIILVPALALVTMSLKDILEKASDIRKENEQRRMRDEIKKLSRSDENTEMTGKDETRQSESSEEENKE